MADLDAIVRYLDAELRTTEIPDHDSALNGLQLANSGTVTRVAAAVDYSAASVAGAVRERADLLIVHHGMFWRGNQRFVGVAYERLRSAMAAGLAVYSSHIPLDLHTSLGNNVLLARELGRDGIRINAVAMSYIWDAEPRWGGGSPALAGAHGQGMIDNLRKRMLFPVHCADIAQAAAFFAGPESDAITGQTLSVNGGLSTPG